MVIRASSSIMISRCWVTDDCYDALSCINGECRPPCFGDRDCQDDWTCNGETGECEPPVEPEPIPEPVHCYADDECSHYEFCNQDTMLCETRPDEPEDWRPESVWRVSVGKNFPTDAKFGRTVTRARNASKGGAPAGVMWTSSA